MLQTLCFLFLVTAPVFAAPEARDSTEAHTLEEEVHPESEAVVSGEHLQDDLHRVHVPMEDAASWSESTEVLDENHAWYDRSRRSLEGVKEDEEDLEAAETAIFMPAHLRLRKKRAHSECREMLQNYETRKKRHPHHHHQPTWHCNGYCCFPLSSP